MTRNGRPRLVFVCPNLEAGGAERQWLGLVPALAGRGFDVSVLTLDGRGAYFDDLRAGGVPVVCARLRNRADPAGLARALRLAGPSSSVVVSRDVSAHVVGHAVARRQRAAHVVTEHLGPDPLGVRPLRRHQRALLRPVRPHVAAVVAVARSQREHLVRDGYPSGAIRVIPNGVASDPAVRPRAAVRAELGIAPEEFLAVLAAALRPEKRAAAFVEAVAAAHAIEPAVRGLVLGAGPDSGAVAGAVARSGGAVRALGYRPDALDVIAAANVLCLTSVVEALPMSVLEAMSLARPVVATDVGGVAEAVADGETGVLVPRDRPSDMAAALAALARDRPRAEALGRAGRERQRRLFSIHAMTASYAELLGAVAR
jgi:glycosyltransferase involved in cell wall biosynthesis